ncbi:uncharacterized protein GGS25DRAFT_107093 [Hypoxylon fragiforme]|uniref:uncharacterized protein n=1 Tax=Hypoxylon fragiforme TaxID=63214 RepID=UPI0020C71FA2|nr:uncharacterized protein GGS25DRAFT_107093 [Hypoxylon fragiforme]KAI2612131.1 hypothetical protein GGS25DRAFT_107093 [Hypoxylon fragiforme]
MAPSGDTRLRTDMVDLTREPEANRRTRLHELYLIYSFICLGTYHYTSKTSLPNPHDLIRQDMYFTVELSIPWLSTLLGIFRPTKM